MISGILIEESSIILTFKSTLKCLLIQQPNFASLHALLEKCGHQHVESLRWAARHGLITDAASLAPVIRGIQTIHPFVQLLALVLGQMVGRRTVRELPKHPHDEAVMTDAAEIIQVQVVSMDESQHEQ